ncbi:hypothetical protein [Rhodococcoides kyotonense]|uniref:Uncharacterized protein n=1 Tax=Rhodococcoides kyotonense TaxID=398843 RepID=A0A177YLV1_9NOCA|nr:hypothetical protein [Rhodococcus kyotonensis]OAK56240.1 hypothetical protein A3K89_17350 [Rhodococcus kyotonensis]
MCAYGDTRRFGHAHPVPPGGGAGILVELDLTSPNSGRLAYFGNDCAGIYTGATYGVTEVVTEGLDGAPDDDLDDWKTVEEATIETTSQLRLLPHPATHVQTLEALAATAITMPDTAPGAGMGCVCRPADGTCTVPM